MLISQHLQLAAFARDTAVRAGRPEETLGAGAAELPFVLHSEEICWDCLCRLPHMVDTSPQSRCWQAEQALEDPSTVALLQGVVPNAAATATSTAGEQPEAGGVGGRGPDGLKEAKFQGVEEDEGSRLTSTGLTYEELKAIQLDAMADDVPIELERMQRWTEDEARSYFESGGEDEPQVP